MLTVSEIYIYPIKSLGGIKLDRAQVTDRGLQHDRRWMLIDDNNRFLSQREHPKMALLNTAITDEFLVITDTITKTSINIPLVNNNELVVEATIWDDTCPATLVNIIFDDWFSNALGIKCRLVYMADNSHRFTDPRYAPDDSITSFSDAYPFLLVGQSSLDELNSRLENPLPINRFRPNIVYTGDAPFAEDLYDELKINGVMFNGVKLCARCNMTTIDQDTASVGKEPLKTLARYRNKNKKIMFGQNLIHSGTGVISVGDELTVVSTHTDERFIL